MTVEPVDAVASAPPPPRRVRRFPPPALGIRTYRWYWITQWPVLVGTWMEVVALGYLVYSVSHSTAAVSLVAACDGLPAVAFSLVGGVLADRLPRRRILIATQATLGMSAVGLAVLAGTGHASVAAIAVIAAVYGATDSIDLPTRQALVSDLVDKELIVDAVALGAAAMSASRVIGPALGGWLIASVGPAACFAFLGAAYLAPLAVLVCVIPDIAPLARSGSSTPVRDAAVGLRMAVADPLVRPVLAVATMLALFGVSYMPFLPVIADRQLHTDGHGLGLMYSVGGIGGLVAGLLISVSGGGAPLRVRLLFGGGIVYAIALFEMTHSTQVLMAIPGLLGISFGFLAMNTAMTTLLQTETPPAMRGRLLGVYAMLLAGVQPLGTLAYGAVGSVVPLGDAIGVGGVLVGATAVWAATRGPLRRLGTAA